ncbi:MAG: RNA polymerase sigma factor [Deltaproteobacteria bacterium]|nr:RNA polymerase sigma factor [Deltaproteobacteria bacterium]
MNPELIQKARSGDGEAFTLLVEPLRPLLLAYLYRRVAAKEEAEDLCQEVLMSAYLEISQFDAAQSFKLWLFQFASRLADPLTEGRQPWGVSALEVLQDYLLEHEAIQGELQATLEEEEEAYSIADHVDFCFTVQAQSLFSKERNVLLLTELQGFSDAEAKAITGFPLDEAREKHGEAVEALRELFAERCSLVKAGAPCTQCRDFSEWLSGPEETEEELRDLPLQPTVNPEASFEKRLQWVAKSHPLRNASSRFHEHLMQTLRRALGEKGLLKP